MEVVGSPSATNMFVFNGDFVDRGAWCARLLDPGGVVGRQWGCRSAAACQLT
jgi:hypothetical protein